MLIVKGWEANFLREGTLTEGRRKRKEEEGSARREGEGERKELRKEGRTKNPLTRRPLHLGLDIQTNDSSFQDGKLGFSSSIWRTRKRPSRRDKRVRPCPERGSGSGGGGLVRQLRRTQIASEDLALREDRR